MPDAEGELSEEERTIVVEYLKKAGPKGNCPSCEHNTWSLVSHIASLPATIKVVGKITTIPVVVLMCDTCAFVRLHSAIRMGLTKRGGVSDG